MDGSASPYIVLGSRTDARDLDGGLYIVRRDWIVPIAAYSQVMDTAYDTRPPVTSGFNIGLYVKRITVKNLMGKKRPCVKRQNSM